MSPIRAARGESGLSMPSILISMVIAALLLSAAFSFYFVSARDSDYERVANHLYSVNESLLSFMSNTIEGAGFGIPSTANCPGGLIGYNSQIGYISMAPITPSTESASQYYNGTSSSMSFTSDDINVFDGGGSTGSAPLTYVNHIPAMTSSRVFLDSNMGLQQGDFFITEIPGQACFLSQVTNVDTLGVISNSGNFSPFNPPLSFSALDNYLVSKDSSLSPLSATQFNNAHFINMGKNTTYYSFFISLNSAGFPTLYLSELSNSGSLIRVPLLEGVVDMVVQLGIGTSGVGVQTWEYPSSYVTGQNILAVRLGILTRSIYHVQGFSSPSSYDVMGLTYNVPSTGGVACAQGDCRDYAYVYNSVTIPVRNIIWQ